MEGLITGCILLLSVQLAFISFLLLFIAFKINNISKK